MSERELSDLLGRVVPEPPDGVASAGPVVAAGRASRRRRRALAAGGVVVVAAVTVVAVVLVPRPDTTHPVPDVVQPARPTSTAPYTAPACPTSDLGHRMPTPSVRLDDVVSIRLCENRGGPRDDVAPLDALVTHLDDLATVVAALPPAGASYGRISCGLADFAQAPVVVQLNLTDGSRPSVDTYPCSNVSVDGREVDAHRFEQAVLDLLDEQRSDLGTTSPMPRALSCVDEQSEAPVRPARDPIVAAVLCDPASPGPQPLTTSALARLNEAWRQPGPLANTDCPVPRDPPTVVAATDRGDIVVLTQPFCATLVFVPRRAFDSSGLAMQVPVRIYELE